jgi:ankyrin repeat protein
MKIKILLMVTFLASAMGLRAATNDLTSLLQQGLFDEEANHDLTSAIADYQSLATQFDRDRQVAATAIYRLGECYRKLGQTNEAVSEYQRIIKEFGEQQDLVTLSQQNLTGLGAGENSSPERPAGETVMERLTRLRQAEIASDSGETKSDKSKQDTASGEAQLLSAQLAGLDQLQNDPEKRAFAVLALFPDDDLKQMLLHLVFLDKQVNDVADANVPFPLYLIVGAMGPEGRFGNLMCPTNRAGALHLAQAQTQKQLAPIKQRVDFIIGLQQARLQVLQSGAGLANGKPKEADATASYDGEDRQIQRLQDMLQNSPDLINANGNELGRAANSGELRVAAFLLDHGANVNGNDTQNIPLVMAALNGQKTMVELLLSRGADVNAGAGTGNTALRTAAASGYQAVVEVLLAHKADVNATDNNQENSPLEMAVINDHVKILQMLLAAGANPNAATKDGVTPLQLAAQRGDLAVIKMLLTAGANPNAGDKYGRPPLFFAVTSGSEESVKLLLAAKANPNGGSVDAPLFSAIYKMDVVSAEMLLQAGASPNDVGTVDREAGAALGSDRQRLTPLFQAVSTDQLPMVQLLLKYHADPNAEQADKRPVIFSALADTNLLETLLDAGANVDARYSIDGQSPYNKSPDWTPLMMAVINSPSPDGHFPSDSVAILLKHGANPNAPDEASGDTPLLWSTGWSDHVPNRHVLELLLENKADPNHANFAGQTLLGRLKTMLNNHSPEEQVTINNLASLLRQHGALDNLPDWNHITASRPSANFSRAVFTRETNDWNKFTLLELVAVECQFLAVTPADGGNGGWPAAFTLSPSPAVSPTGGKDGVPAANFQAEMAAHMKARREAMATHQSSLFWQYNQPLPFSDLAQIRIRRPEPGLTNIIEQTVDLAASLSSGDCSNDVFLKWGDVVEIPETDHLINQVWQGFSLTALTNLDKCLTRHVEIIVKGQTNVITLALETKSDNGFTRAITFAQKVSFWLGPVVLQSKLVLASSDLAHVKVTRHDPATGKIESCLVDCSGISQNQFRNTDLWLRDGDVIEIPEKP